MAKDFTWHEVFEKEKEQIRDDSKKLLKTFGKKLEKIKAPEEHFAPKKMGYTERCQNQEGTREEGDGWNTDPDFRDIMFANAPFVEDEFIVAEKGGWK